MAIRFLLSLRDTSEILLVRDIELSYETIREWSIKFSHVYAKEVKRRMPRPGVKWHLSVSQHLTGINDIAERNKTVTLIQQGSMMTWAHLNLGGEYDFTLASSNDNPFDMDKILELKLK